MVKTTQQPFFFPATCNHSSDRAPAKANGRPQGSHPCTQREATPRTRGKASESSRAQCTSGRAGGSPHCTEQGTAPVHRGCTFPCSGAQPLCLTPTCDQSHHPQVQVEHTEPAAEISHLSLPAAGTHPVLALGAVEHGTRPGPARPLYLKMAKLLLHETAPFLLM